MRAERSPRSAHPALFLITPVPGRLAGRKPRRFRYAAQVAATAAVLGLALGAAGCSSTPRASGNDPRVVHVVAAERLWGSIAAQLGGEHAAVDSIISNPGIDPRTYRATAADRRAFGAAQLVILNGAGYDPWADQLANSTPGNRRTELNVGDNVGVAPGGNPYLWYDPDYVQRVAALILADYARIDPRDAGYFERRMKVFEDGLVPYEKLVYQVKGAYADSPVGASTPAAAPLATALGLKLITPTAFLQAMAANARPSAADTATADSQISGRKIRLYIYDSDTASPAVRAQLNEARAHGVPVVGVSAMLSPVTATFQRWQAGEVLAVERALAVSTGR